MIFWFHERETYFIAAIYGYSSRTLERCIKEILVLQLNTERWFIKRKMDENEKPHLPGRLNDLRHIIYKSASSHGDKLKIIWVCLKRLKEILMEALKWALIK